VVFAVDLHYHISLSALFGFNLVIVSRDVKRGQMLEAEAKHLRSRPRPEPRGRGQNLEAEVEAEAKFNRPNPRTKLKRPNRTLYFTMKINEYMP